MQAFLNVENVSFQIDNQPILTDIHFQLSAGRIAALLGPSGCGKTTLLRLIAGFMAPTAGQIRLNQQVVSTPDGALSPEHRGLGMVFQDYALFPHLSVFDNITFGLKKLDKAAAKQRVGELLEMVSLPGYENRYPHELSGGEQQRVAIARAIAPHPKLLLMDEPFASLDANLRERLVRDLGTLLKQLDIAAILVTHDQREAFAASEYIGLMRQGRILQWDSPYRIYHQPNETFVANFVGQGVMIKATVITETAVDTALGVVQSQQTLSVPVGTQLCMLIRPDDIVEDKNAAQTATISHKFFHGASTLYELDYQGTKLVANVNSHADYAVGETIHFAVKAHHLVTFDHGEAECVC